MLLNVTQSRLVIGRFTILPGDKGPAFALTDAETKAVEDFRNRGFLAEKEVPKQPPAPKKAREANKGAPKADLPAEAQNTPATETEMSGESKGE